MINILYHRGFVREFKKLPKAIKLKCAHLELVFRDFPFHPELHSKKLSGKLQDFYSFRIRRDYRVIYRFIASEESEFLSIRHRRDIYKK